MSEFGKVCEGRKVRFNVGKSKVMRGSRYIKFHVGRMIHYDWAGSLPLLYISGSNVSTAVFLYVSL